MTENSKICRYIRDHPGDWQDYFEQVGIKWKTDGDLTIFNYMPGCDFSNPLVCEARGIIINRNLDVVCWPFRKFFNVQEFYAANIDWSTARVQDKIDGSIIKLWYNWLTLSWQLSTMSVIDAKESTLLNGKNFDDLFKSAVNYSDIKWNYLNRFTTYIFELVSPDSQVVIHYPTTKIWHIGTVCNLNGVETEIDIGVEHPDEYPLETLDDCMTAVEKLNTDDNVKKEGFVVVDGNFNRIKIKSPQYLALHRTVNNHKLSAEKCIELIVTSSQEDIDDFCNTFPQHERKLRYYQWQLAELKYAVDSIICFAKSLYEEYDCDRKAVARILLRNRLSSFGFKALDSNQSANEMIDMLTPKQIVKYIEEYGI